MTLEEERDLLRMRVQVRCNQLCMLRDWLQLRTEVWDKFVREYPHVEKTWFDEDGGIR